MPDANKKCHLDKYLHFSYRMIFFVVALSEFVMHNMIAYTTYIVYNVQVHFDFSDYCYVEKPDKKVKKKVFGAKKKPVVQQIIDATLLQTKSFFTPNL